MHRARVDRASLPCLRLDSLQRHPALGTITRMITFDTGTHRTDVLPRLSGCGRFCFQRGPVRRWIVVATCMIFGSNCARMFMLPQEFLATIVAAKIERHSIAIRDIAVVSSIVMPQIGSTTSIQTPCASAKHCNNRVIVRDRTIGCRTQGVSSRRIALIACPSYRAETGGFGPHSGAKLLLTRTAGATETTETLGVFVALIPTW